LLPFGLYVQSVTGVSGGDPARWQERLWLRESPATVRVKVLVSFLVSFLMNFFLIKPKGEIPFNRGLMEQTVFRETHGDGRSGLIEFTGRFSHPGLPG